MRPGLYGGVQEVPRTLRHSLRLGLSVAKHHEGPGDLLSLQGAGDQPAVGGHGGQAGVVVGEVPQEAETVTHRVEAASVSSLHVPAPALVDEAVSAEEKTEKLNIFLF